MVHSGGCMLDGRDFAQVTWDEQTADDCRQIIRLAVREDLNRGHDVTSMGLVSRTAKGSAFVVVRNAAIVAGVPVVKLVIEEMNLAVDWTAHAADGTAVESATRAGQLQGST